MQNGTRKSALLVMDVQNGIVSRLGDQQAQAVAVYRKAVQAARSHGLLVIFARVAFSAGYVEVSPHNKAFANMGKYGGMSAADASTQIHESILPEENEPVVTKYRVSAFAGSNLEVILRAQQVETVILSGISTSGVVLSTLREAADKDYEIKVLADACFDPDPAVHQVLMEKVFPRQADVTTVDACIGSLT